MQITTNRIVSIDYRLTDELGELLDTSEGQEPLSYIHGMSEIIPGLEAALEGHSVGDQLQVTIEPEDAYGARLEDLCFELSRDDFEDIEDLEIGMQFKMSTEDDEDDEHVVTVIEVNDETVVVDGNHMLAGVTLCFDVTVRDVREATVEELEQRLVEEQ
jgi:FKBP-type peptidyl-prolyl cis-trans isomerase SlyD